MRENENIKRYQELREVGKTLNDKLFEHLDKDAMGVCATFLDLIDDTGGFIFESEVDMDKLGDLVIHDFVDKDDKTALNKLAESKEYILLSEDEKIILQAKLNSFQSLFLVDKIKPSEGLIVIKDVYNKFKSTEIIDLGLSQSLKLENSYLFMRIMRFEHFSCSTGVISIFNKNKISKVRNTYAKQAKTHWDLKPRTKKPVIFFHLNRKYGNKISFR